MKENEQEKIEDEKTNILMMPMLLSYCRFPIPFCIIFVLQTSAEKVKKDKKWCENNVMQKESKKNE